MKQRHLGHSSIITIQRKWCGAVFSFWLQSRPKTLPTARSSQSYDPVREKTNNLDSDQVWHKPGCTATGRLLEAWNFLFRKKRYCTTQVAKTKALISFAVTGSWSATLCFRICKSLVFSRRGSYNMFIIWTYMYTKLKFWSFIQVLKCFKFPVNTNIMTSFTLNLQ